MWHLAYINEEEFHLKSTKVLPPGARMSGRVGGVGSKYSHDEQRNTSVNKVVGTQRGRHDDETEEEQANLSHNFGLGDGEESGHDNEEWEETVVEEEGVAVAEQRECGEKASWLLLAAWVMRLPSPCQQGQQGLP
jgi:hypothetical protein